jgi:hypothetical protein
MSVRTPGIQSRSQFHSYWGVYVWDTAGVLPSFAGRTADAGSQSLPNAPNNIISAIEWAKLENGDVAATQSFSVPTGTEYGFWTCIYKGTSGGGNAVWVRCDSSGTAAVQTVRDAHVIVVGQQGYLTALAAVAIPPLATNSLNLGATGDQLGVTCDYLDTGNGAELDLALQAALASGIAVDVRLRPCAITLTGGATPAVLTMPANCRLLGAGKGLSTITGTTGASAAVQNVFTVQAGATLEDLSVVSPAPTAAPGASGLGVINCEEGVQIRRCSVSLERSTTVNRNGTRAGISFITGGGDFGFELVADCELNIDSLVGQPTPTSSFGVAFGQAAGTALTSFDPEVRDTTVDEFTTSVGSCPLAVAFVNVEGGFCFNVQHYNADFLGSFSWSWAFPSISPPVTRLLRGPRFVECRAEAAVRAVQLATTQFGFLVSVGNVANNFIQGMSGTIIDSCVVRFDEPGTPSAAATLNGITIANLSADAAVMFDSTISDCRVENAHRAFRIQASETGIIESVRITGCQGRDTIGTGAATARGLFVEGNPVSNSPTVLQVGVQNCDFTGSPASGVGVDIADVRVENTIVLGNNLTPNGGTAITDAGTGTEAAHNITV